jgi:hypothetical protein
LLLYVRAGKDYVQAVAGIENCPSVSWSITFEQDISTMNSEERFIFISNRIQSVVAAIAMACNADFAEAIPTDELRRLFLPPQALAN